MDNEKNTGYPIFDNIEDYYKIHLIEVGIEANQKIMLAIDQELQDLKNQPLSKERSIATTKLQEAIMWLGLDLKRLNNKDRVYNKNPKNISIEIEGINL